MSEDKPDLPNLEMPRLSQDVLNRWAVSMEAAGKAVREFGDALRAAYPSIQARMDAAVKAVQPPSQKVSDKSA